MAKLHTREGDSTLSWGSGLDPMDMAMSDEPHVHLLRDCECLWVPSFGTAYTLTILQGGWCVRQVTQ